MPNPWFRLYSEIIDDPKLLLLAFEDRWHYVALLALKNRGELDDGSPELMRRKVAVKLGVDVRSLDEVARRLAEVDLIDRDTLQPTGWDGKQFRSDTSKERVAAYRERQKAKAKQSSRNEKQHSNVTETTQETDTDTDTDTEKEKGLAPTAPRRKTDQPNSGEADQPTSVKWTPADKDLSQRMLDRIRDVSTAVKGSPSWADDIRLMRERDGRSLAEIWDLFEWANNDDFWRANILSPRKLREKWAALEGQRKRRRPGVVDNRDSAARAAAAIRGDIQ